MNISFSLKTRVLVAALVFGRFLSLGGSRTAPAKCVVASAAVEAKTIGGDGEACGPSTIALGAAVIAQDPTSIYSAVAGSLLIFLGVQGCSVN